MSSYNCFVYGRFISVLSKMAASEKAFADSIRFLGNNRRVYEGKDAFLWLSTSFGKSVRYEVLSFACLTVNKAKYLQGRVVTSLSC